MFLWRPIFTGRALLPGGYLMQMAPWRSADSPALRQAQDAASPRPTTADSPPSTVDSGPQWNPLQWDAIAQFYPWRVFYARSMRSGHIPLWNPHQFSGTPFLANGQSACLYPLNLVFLIFDPITAFTIFAALHLFLAQVFMYWLMRELGAKELGGIVAAVTFAFSAFMVLWLELPTFVSVAVWLPLALMLVNRAVERRMGLYGMLAGLVLGLTFLAGHFQIAFYVVLATGLWWLWKMVAVWRTEGTTYMVLKVIWPLIGCIVIAGLIAAPQVLPTQELAANSHRVRAVTEEGYQKFVSNAVPTYRLVTAFAPRFFGDPSQSNYYLLGKIGDTGRIGSAADYMEYGMYAGILPLMLALIALASVRKKHVGFFVLLTALAFLTALGTPINRLFYFEVPGFSALGGPNRILLLYLFGIAALAGFGIDWLNEGVDDPVCDGCPRAKLAQCAVGLAAAGAGGLFAWFRGAAWVVHPLLPPVASLATAVAGAFLAASVIIPAARTVRIIHSAAFSVLAVGLITVDLLTFGINYNPTCDRSEVYPRTKLTTELQRLTKNGERIAPINAKWSLFETPKDTILPPNAAMVYGLYDVQGYDSLYTKAYQEKMARLEGLDPSPPENGNMVLVRHEVREGKLKDVAAYIIAHDSPPEEYWFKDETAGLATDIMFWPIPYGRLLNQPIPTRETYLDPNHLITWGKDAPSAGWVKRDYPLDAPVWWAGVTLPLGKPTGRFSYEPFSFRFGLFLMLIGVGALTCVGTYRARRYTAGLKR